MVRSDPDGSILLTTDEVADLLVAAVNHAGGKLISWQLDHVDTAPHHSTTATYYVEVEWPHGRRTELWGVSSRAGAAAGSDTQVDIFVEGEREVAVWMYPTDPDLPGLARAAYPDQLSALMSEHSLFTPALSAEELSLEMIGYRPRRRAVLRAKARGKSFYIKVLRPKVFADIALKHQLLTKAGVPSPEVVVTTDDSLLILGELPGMSLAQAIFHEELPARAEDLIETLDTMPASVAKLDRRPGWSEAIEHYATIVSQALPSQESRLEWLVHEITSGLRGIPAGNEATHGDFHEGQIHVAGSRVVGILDIDTIGPGRRADDLACLIAHMSTIQGMNQAQAAQLRALLRQWVPVFDERVDPIELRLRAAAVVVSLATGPYRSQDPDWQIQTEKIVSAAVALVRQVT